MPIQFRQKSGEVRKAFEAFVIAAADEATRHGYELDIARKRIKELETSRANCQKEHGSLRVAFENLQKRCEEKDEIIKKLQGADK